MSEDSLSENDPLEDSFELFLTQDYCATVQKSVIVHDDIIIKETLLLQECDTILQKLQEEEDCMEFDYELIYEKCPVCCREQIRKKPIKIDHIKTCALKQSFTPEYVIELLRMCRTERRIRESSSSSSQTYKKPVVRRPRKPVNEVFEIQLFDEEHKKTRIQQRIQTITRLLQKDNDSDEESDSNFQPNFPAKKPRSWVLADMKSSSSDYIVAGFERYFIESNSL